MQTSEGLRLRGKAEIFARATPAGIDYKILRFLSNCHILPRKVKAFFSNIYFAGGWEFVQEQHNLITNIGYQTIADSLTGTGTYTGISYPYFAWSDGTGTPALTNTATTFYADGTAWDTKAVTSIDTFSVSSLKQTWNCFLSSTDNAVASITKFAMMNADPGTRMFNELKFTAISKNSQKEFYIRYSLTMSQV